jgi:hypothetical protein
MRMIFTAYLNQILYIHNGALAHLHNTVLYGRTMWDVEGLGACVCVLEKAAELWPFNLLKWLIAGNDPFH